MNREIIFRGIRCSLQYEGQEPWVYGYYVESYHSWNGHKPHKSWITPSARSNGGWFALQGAIPVKDETVGQYTGLKDCNDNKIFEGDIFDIGGLLKGVVTWHNDGYWCIANKDISHNEGMFKVSYRPLGEMIDYAIQRNCKYEVVGNVHEQIFEK